MPCYSVVASDRANIISLAKLHDIVILREKILAKHTLLSNERKAYIIFFVL